MHASKDSMWWGIWKILQNFLELNKALDSCQNHSGVLFSTTHYHGLSQDRLDQYQYIGDVNAAPTSIQSTT
jgi:hypothetical protein